MSKNAGYLSVVQGNDFEISVNVTTYSTDLRSYSDYDMSLATQVCLFLVGVTGGRRYKLPITVDGSTLTAPVDGSLLNVGLYGLELLFQTQADKSKRSYEPALLKIARTNAEATYDQVEFDSNDDCRLHLTLGLNTSFITIGSPTADTQIDGTSYNAVSNAAVTEAITNLQTQIDNIGAEILDPASVFTKEETEALVDTMIDSQELSDYVSNELSNYTTTEQFNSSVNDLNTRISSIEENPVDLSSYVSKEELNSAAYLQADALDGLATESYVVEKVAAVDVTDQLTDYATKSYVTEQIANIPQADMSAYVSKDYLSQQSYLQADDLGEYATKSFVSEQIEAIPAPDLSAYATKSFVSEQIANIPAPDLSAYVTETELTNTLSSYAKVSDIEDNERVVSTALNSLSDRIESVEGDYVSDTELDEALLPYATEAFVVEKIDELSPSDLNEYVSKQFLSQQAYLQADDISDVVRDSDLSSAGYVTTTELSSAGYVTNTDLSSAGYVTTTELSSAGYVTNTDLSSAGYVTNTDLSSAGYVTTTDLTSAGYVTNTDLASAGYVTTTELSSAGYVTNTDLASAGYVTTTELSNAGYVTTTNLNTTLSSYAKVSDIEDNEQVISSALNSLSDRIGLIENDYVSDDELADYATKNYVDNKIDELSPSDLNEYVSKQFLSQQGYITANDVSSMGYITTQDVSAMGYATTQYVTDQIANIPATDLSSYVSKSELNAAGYITANDVSSMGYATTQYVTDQIANIPSTDLSGYVSKSELNAAAYITESDVSEMGYITANDVAAMGYVTESELSSASYVTNTALNTTLASYTTKADVPYKFVVMSYSDYTALATKDPNTFYCIPEE